MIIKNGIDMFANLSPDIGLIVTANSSLTNHRELVMGCGAALQMKTMFPGISGYFYHQIKEYNYATVDYGVLFYQYRSLTGQPSWDQMLGIFQVKRFWRDKASLDLIKFSTHILDTHIRYNKSLSHIKTWRMNLPGIGAGGLAKQESEIRKDILFILPDNVEIYKL